MAEKEALATITFELLTETQATELAQGAVGSLDQAPRLVESVGSLLAPIVQAAPDGARAIAEKGKYLVEFSAEGDAALAQTVLKFLERRDGRLQPTLVNEAGRFQENAVLAGPAGQRMVAAAAVAHVAILLAVQAQLVSMENRLESIEKKVDEIRRLLDQQKLAQVRGRLRALQKLRDELASNEWSTDNRLRWQVALDQAETELHQVAELARMQCEDATRGIQSAKMNVDFFGSSGWVLVDELQRHIDRYRQYEELALLCVLGRVVVAHLRLGPEASASTEDLERDIGNALSASRAHEGLVQQRSLEFTTKFRGKDFEVATRKRLHDEAQSVRMRTEQQITSLREQLKNISPSRPRLARALVEVAEGRVRTVELLK